AQNIVALIKNAVDSMAALGTFIGVNDVTAQIFADSLIRVVNAIDQAAAAVDIVGVKAGERFSTAAQATIAMIKNAVDGLESLAPYSGVAPATINRFALDVQLTVQALNNVAAQMNLDATSAAGKFSAAAQAILVTIKDAVSGLSSLATYQGVMP